MDKEIMHIVRLEAKKGNTPIHHFWASKCSVSMLKAVENCIPKEIFIKIKQAIEKKKKEFRSNKTPEQVIETAQDLGLKYGLFSGFKSA